MLTTIINALISPRELWTRIRQSLLIREFALFSMATIISQGAGFVISVVTARMLGPTRMGLWTMLGLILIYGASSHLGVLNAMNRDVPICKGQGDADRMMQIRRVALGITLLTAIVGSLAIVVGSAFAGSAHLRLLLWWMALTFLGNQVLAYYQVYLTSDRQFAALSYQRLAFALISPLIIIPLVKYFGIVGMEVGVLLVALLNIVAIWPIITPRVRPLLDIRLGFQLAQIGFPILLVGLLYTLLTTVDRWVIAHYLGKTQLGYYSVATIGKGTLTLIPMMISQQIYPRMAETWGRTRRYRDMARWLRRQTAMGLAITAPVLVLVFLLFPFFVHWFMPAFAPGLPAFQVLLIAPLFLVLAGSSANFLNTVDRQYYALAVQAAALVVNAACAVAFVHLGFGLVGVAASSVLGFAVYGIGMTSAALWVLRRGIRQQLAAGESATEAV